MSGMLARCQASCARFSSRNRMSSWSRKDIAGRIHQTLPFRFRRTEYRFALSQDLFSSHEIDPGSRLLLQELQNSAIDTAGAVYDIGCGTGVLGIVAAREFNAERLVMEDRSALAAAFAEFNAEQNGLAAIAGSFCRAVGAGGLPSAVFDLVLSNVPAKAGQPVRTLLLQHALASCTPGGLCAFVLVKALATETEAELRRLDVAELRVFPHAGHTVFLASPGDRVNTALTRNAASTYHRGTPVSHTIESTSVRQQGIWGLGEFETPSFQTLMLAKMLRSFDATAPLMFWNPGSGLLPSWVRKSFGGRPLTVWTDDALCIMAVHETLLQNRSRRTRVPVSALLSSSIRALQSSVQEGSVIVLSIDASLSSGARSELDRFCEDLSGMSISMVVAGNSAEVSRIERQRWASVHSRSRSRGLRGLVLRIR